MDQPGKVANPARGQLNKSSSITIRRLESCIFLCRGDVETRTTHFFHRGLWQNSNPLCLEKVYRRKSLPPESSFFFKLRTFEPTASSSATVKYTRLSNKYNVVAVKCKLSLVS